ncbi:GGDEF/EAL domain-containing response regulator [Parendozoicomonas haliclonae]|uniref:Cyclic di-GMP phosphodiesterase Gmr n=1 Tax=Parendozoicomonas haliclonae TaxID=1960125 RepID=A0A1X7APX8_9GAMM|nr:EAL domain-containing protein [Parendozoicomonas haliclonae]SMA50149.1 Cyclic di-GMP phosphodiesterase Gmr [Parendozoicomonas haliclonae]
MASQSGQYRPSRYKEYLQSQGPLRLLVLEDSSQSVEPLVSLFRNEGFPTRVHRVTSAEDLDESLAAHLWDMFIIFQNAEALSADESLAHIIRLDRDIPTLILTENDNSETVVQWLAAGGTDAIPVDQGERFILVCLREWYNLVQRRQRRANELALKDAERRCQLLLNSSVDAIAYIHEGMHIHANPTYLEMFGFMEPEDLAGISLIDIIHRDDQGRFKQFFRQFQLGNEDTPPLDFKGQREDGDEFQATMSLSSAKWDDEQCTQIIIRKAAADPELEKKLEALKNTDQITGLFNRAYFTEKLDKAIEQVHSHQGRFSMLDIRLDRFDDLKNELGVEISDQFLAKAAELISGHFDDQGCLARYSGGRFLALVGTDIHTTLEDQASRLVADVKDFNVRINNASVETTASVGIMPITETADSSQYILGRAEKACLSAQNNGGNRHQFHDQQQELQELAKEGDTVALIQHALENDQFRLTYQPIINTEDEQEQQYEVFSRLTDSDGETVAAADFLPAARRANLTTRIDRWVILHAIKTLSEHRAKGNNSRLFITLGLESMQDQTLPAWINVAVRAAKIPGDALVFQLCEEDVALAGEDVLPVCEAFKKLECQLCLTHFGGAADPMALLSALPVDAVKLDDALVAGMDSDQQVLSQLQDTIRTLQQKGKQVMVPKVESNKILSTLWGFDVNYVQGNFLQPPTSSMSYEFQ